MVVNANGLPPLHQAEGMLPPDQSREFLLAVEAERIRRAAAAVVDAEQAAAAAMRRAMEG